MIDIEKLIQSFRTKNDSSNTKYDTTINHTRMEELIFEDKKLKIDELYKETDYTIADIEEEGSQKLSSFKGITQDMFNCFYKINPTDRDEDILSDQAKKFNKQIIQKAKENPEYGALKLITEGKDFESIEAAREFTKGIYDKLDELLKDTTGDSETLNVLNKLENVLEQKNKQLEIEANIYKELQKNGGSPSDLTKAEAKINSLIEQTKGIQKNINQYNDIIKANAIRNKDKIEAKIDETLKKTLNHVNEVKDILDTWGTNDGRPQSIEGKTSLINKVKSDPVFKKMAIEVGRMRRLSFSTMNKRFTFERGQKIGIKLGNKLNKTLPSEFVLLANKETEVLFFKKFADKKLKQYKEKEEIHEGRGHVIYMVDESGSTRGEKAIWAKALGIALMDIAVKDYRNFAFIPFDTKVGNVHHVNYNNYSDDIVFQIANTFLGGGTNFTGPIRLATELLEEDRYNNADLVFVTDGHAIIDEDVLAKFNTIKEKKKCKCVGVLLDKGGYDNVSDNTIKEFCDVIYKTSELTSDEIATKVMSGII